MQSTQKYDIGLLLLRLGFGALMILEHGWPKLQRILAGNLDQFGDPIGLGPELSLLLVTFAEFLCAILLMFGLFTRWALIPLIIAMLVAVFVANWGDPLSDKELGLLYLTAFFCLLFTGPGWYSLDRVIRKSF